MPHEHTRDSLERVLREFPDLPREALVKEDILRTGLDLSEEALRVSSAAKPKSYFIFSFDRKPISELDRGENLRAPEEIALVGGPEGFRRTIVSVRIHPGSPYRVEVEDSRLVLRAFGELLSEVELQPLPSYYRRSVRGGRPVTELAPTIEWGYLVYLTLYRKCQYFGFKEECLFCDMNENYRQQRAAGRPYETVKDVNEILEALEIVDAEDVDRQSRAYTITGGSITEHLKGEGELEFYARHARAINSRFPGRWISKAVVQAHEKDQLLLLRDAGVQIYHPNYEVWDPRLFEALCPGKAKRIGRDVWLSRILDAREVFGAPQVVPNFVAGVELAKPHGFERVDEALHSTGEGLEYFMSRGIVPRFTTWCPEPLSVLGSDQGPAPLEYHAGLLRLWKETLLRHRLPAPAGYGEPGAGRAVFSVSAFLDVLDAAHPVAPLAPGAVVDPSRPERAEAPG